MKKIVLAFVFALMCITSWAGKVLTIPVSITQSDGTQLTVIGYGDENFHYYTTTDGVLLYHEGFNYYVAFIDDNGNVSKTTQLAHETGQRGAIETQLINAQNKDKFFSASHEKVLETRAFKEAVQSSSTLFPHTGTPKVLVILAQFSDTTFMDSDPKVVFDQYLNAEGALSSVGNGTVNKNFGSVSKYFNDMSFGQFKPQFSIYGPVTLKNPLKYYGAGNDDMNRFVPDVCKAAYESGVDFSQYDQNNDGNVDLVFIIFAGYSESYSGNSSDCICPQSGTVSKVIYNGKNVCRFGVCNELNGFPGANKSYPYKRINGVGLFCHEFSHCMGLPDLYTTREASEECQNANNQELEFWDLMDGGEYVNNGYRPSEYSAWEREALGWMSIDTLKDTTSVVLKTIDNGGKAYRFMNNNDVTGKEYFILENVQYENWNNTTQKGHGMLVYHVDYDENYFSLAYNAVNNTLGHPRMTLIAADGLLLNAHNATDPSSYYAQMNGDPFPGTSNVHFLTDTSTVKPIIYTGTLLNKPILNIQETDGVITFDFLGKKTSTDINNIIVENSAIIKDDRIYSLDGRYIGKDTNTLSKGIYIKNNKKFIVK